MQIIRKNFSFNNKDQENLTKILNKLEEQGINTETSVIRYLMYQFIKHDLNKKVEEPEYDPEKNPVVIEYMNNLRNDKHSCPVCMASSSRCEHLENGEALKKVIRILG